MEKFNALVRDTLPNKNPEGTWQYGRNMLLNKGNKSISNENGLKFQHLVNGTIIGVIVTNSDVVYFSKNSDGLDEIGRINIEATVPTYTTVIKSSLFNFQYNCPIEGVFIYNYKKELIVVWCNGVKDTSSPPFLVNLNNLPVSVDNNYLLQDSLEFTKLKLNADIKQGNIVTTESLGGSIDGVNIYTTYKYIYEDLSETSFFQPTNINSLQTFTNDYYDNLETFKNKIDVTITELDPNFNKIKIGIIIDNEGVLTAHESPILPYTDTTLSYDLVNLTSLTSIDVASITIPPLVLEGIHTLTKQESQLFAGNIKIQEPLNLQSYCNKIVLGSSFRQTADPSTASFMPDEVYAFNIEFHRTNGTYTDAFHIPGRQHIEGGDELLTTTPTDTNYYKPAFANSVVNFKIVNQQHNGFGYWHNEETYPDTPEFDNINSDSRVDGVRNIRYHKMPSVSLTQNILEVRLINIEEIMLSLPSSIREGIQGYRVSYIKRNGGNSLVLGNYNLHQSLDRPDIDVSGYSAMSREDDGFGGYTYENERIDKGFLMGVELVKSAPSLFIGYLKMNYTMHRIGTKNPINTNTNIFSEIEEALQYKPENNIDAETTYSIPQHTVNFKVGNRALETPDLLTSTVNGKINTTAFVSLDTENLYKGFKSSDLIVGSYSNELDNPGEYFGGDVHTNVYNLIACPQLLKEADANDFLFEFIEFNNTYSPFDKYYLGSQPRLKNTGAFATGISFDIDSTLEDLLSFDFSLNIKGKLSTKTNSINTIVTYDTTATYISTFPYRVQKGLKAGNESLDTSTLRTFLPNDYYEMPKDKGGIIALRGGDRKLYIQHKYSLFVATIKDKLVTQNVEAYLGKGDLFDREPTEILGDDKGTIGSTSKFACIIIKGSYITVNQVTGQIFVIGQGVQEISAKGNKNWFWDNWDIGLDYYSIDSNGDKDRIDNPYASVGHLVGFDKQYNRLLFIKKMYIYIGVGENVDYDGEFYSVGGIKLEFSDESNFKNISKTLSYSLDGEGSWAFEHDYFPSIIYNTHKDLVSIQNKLTGDNRASVYTHNDPDTNGLYYGNKFDSYIDLIFNRNLDITKLYSTISWYSTSIKNGVVDRNKTITHIVIYNETQCSGKIELVNIKNYEDEWSFNDFRDLLESNILPVLDDNGDIIESNINKDKLWFDKSNFISKFITVRLITDNVADDDLYIHKVNVKSIISK